MTELKAAFVHTLEDLRKARLAKWDEEHKHELKDLDNAAGSAQSEIKHYARGDLHETQNACEAFLDAMASLTALKIDRRNIEKSFDLVIDCLGES